MFGLSIVRSVVLDALEVAAKLESARLEHVTKHRDELQHLTDELKTVATGCQVHPSYRGVRSPQVGCAQCYMVFEAVTELRAFGVQLRPARKNRKVIVHEETT